MKAKTASIVYYALFCVFASAIMIHACRPDASRTPTRRSYNSGVAVTVFDNGFWYTNSAASIETTSFSYAFGASGDIPVMAFFDKSRMPHIGVFRRGVWILDWNGNNRFDQADKTITFGQAGDYPVTGDWDSSGRARIGIFRNGIWVLDMNGDFAWDAEDKTFAFGTAGDLPVVGDWDNSGKTRIGVFRNGTWLLDWDGDGLWNARRDKKIDFGAAGDLPVVGNWADKKTTIGVYRKGRFFLDSNHDFRWDTGDTQFQFGPPTGLPVSVAP
jgi:hypothetical protein